MQRHEAQKALKELQTLLVPTWTQSNTHETQLALYRDLLSSTFGKHDTQATLSDLEEKNEYIQWAESEHVCILRLSGLTDRQMTTGLCWLSNMVPALVDRFRLKNRPVVFHLTQCIPWMEDDVPVKDIVSSIIIQLLQLKSQDPHDGKRLNDIHHMLRSDLWYKDIKSICETLVTMLEEFETMNIILDRIDRGSCNGGAPRFVERLLEALSVSKCHTRILLVTHPGWATEWDIDILDDMSKKHMYLEIDPWNQTIVSPVSPGGRRRRGQ